MKLKPADAMKKGSGNTEKDVLNKTVGFNEFCISRCAHFLQIQIYCL
jgi:hypothetical protein